MSHELKTPLTSIKGYAETLAHGHEDNSHGIDQATQKRFLKKILDNSERLTNLVNDILSLATIESGDTSDYSEEVDWRQVVEQILERVDKEATKKNLVFQSTAKIAAISSLRKRPCNKSLKI